MEDLEVGDRIILEMISNIWSRRTWIGLMWLMEGVVAGCIEHCDKSLDLKKAGNFFECLIRLGLYFQESL